MLDLIMYNEEARLLFYAIAFLLLTLAAEKYIEKKYNPFEEKEEVKQNERY